MAKRVRSIRFWMVALLLVPLLCLAGLWAFAAILTGADGVALLHSGTIATSIATPSEDVVRQLQAERLASVRALRSGDYGALKEERARTDKLVWVFRTSALDEDAQSVASAAIRAQLTVVFGELDRLGEIRAAVDKGETTLTAINAYSRIVDGIFRMYDKLILVPDITLYQQARAVTALGEGRELFARERALIIGMSGTGRINDQERQAFTAMVSARRYLLDKSVPELDGTLRQVFEDLLNSDAYTRFLAIEDQVRARAPQTATDWQSTADLVWAAVDKDQAIASKALVERVTPTAITLLAQIAVAGGLGLIAVIISVIASVRFGRRFVHELAKLRDAAVELAEARLPRIVARLRAGETVDLATEAPPLPVRPGIEEINDVGQSLNAVQHTAIEAAAEQARMRDGLNHVFLSLARRSQSLLHRQLRQLDAMERKEDEPKALDELYRLDHLTTRMRRQAENLIILSGASPGRGWTRPVPMTDVLRAAVSEVEDYQRVETPPVPRAWLKGFVVADIVHLIAELLENATTFSPPHTRVVVRAVQLPAGLLLQIEDRGLGMPEDELAAINVRLAEMPEFDPAQSDRLGLFVVGRLAAAHGVKVSLETSPFGGVTGNALIPRELVVHDLSLEPVPSPVP